MSNGIGSLGELPVLRNIPVVIHKLLLDSILKGTLAAGSRININEIADKFGISKIPIREALRMLEMDGWVISQPHRGSYVRPMSRDELTEIFEMRKLMEPHCAKLAARRRSAAGVALLENIIAESQIAIQEKNLDSLVELNKRMHESIAEAAGNSLLTASLDKLDLLMRRYFVPVGWEQRHTSMLQHIAIVRAIKDQDEALAERLAFAHICHTEALANKPLISGSVDPAHISPVAAE